MKKFLLLISQSFYYSLLAISGITYFFVEQPFILKLLHTGILTATGWLVWVIIETTLFKQKEKF
ncbi:hypothetical protein QTG56_24175 (plasmid) [Rossellomorea sp. AcN35-11]|nr:hypothetical protein [Rossellomorea aquimaris]WJV31737.1 hypothetical protein QTG56_24175 [Rossellomorea sp. AcN35-11]